MKINAIIQARMSSSRFQGKMLRLIADKPLLTYVIERVQHSKRIDDIIIATSTDSSDNAIENLCMDLNVKCFRGSLNNVASRFSEVINEYPCDGFVRICGDRPLMDQRIIDQATNAFLRKKHDLITNVFPPTFPAGETVEVINSEVFQKSIQQFTKPDHMEHVTKFFYDNSYRFSIFNISSDHDNSNVHFAVDTRDDFELVSKILHIMTLPHWNYSLPEILDIYHGIIREDYADKK